MDCARDSVLLFLLDRVLFSELLLPAHAQRDQLPTLARCEDKERIQHHESSDGLGMKQRTIRLQKVQRRSRKEDQPSER